MTQTTTLQVAAALTAAAFVTASAISLAAPAATGPMSEPALLALADLWVRAGTLTATSATVCASGRVDNGTPFTGRWVFRVVGPTVTYSDQRTGTVYAETCKAMSTAGAPAGTTDASISYVGATGDVAADCTATLTWAPGVPLRWAYGCVAGTPSPPPVGIERVS